MQIYPILLGDFGQITFYTKAEIKSYSYTQLLFLSRMSLLRFEYSHLSQQKG